AAVSVAAPDEHDEMDRQWAQARAWREHVSTKRSHRQARRSSFDAGWEAALAAAHAETERLLRGSRCPECSATEWNQASMMRAERDEARAALAALRARIEGLADEYDDAIPGFVRRLRAALAARSA